MNLNLPFAVDKADKNKPSVTLLFAYISFLLAFSLNIFEALRDPIAALFGSTVLFLICVGLYRMRKLDKIKITRDSVELDSQKDLK